MSNSNTATEPSMDDILDSIRRIISEDTPISDVEEDEKTPEVAPDPAAPPAFAQVYEAPAAPSVQEPIESAPTQMAANDESSSMFPPLFPAGSNKETAVKPNESTEPSEPPSFLTNSSTGSEIENTEAAAPAPAQAAPTPVSTPDETVSEKENLESVEVQAAASSTQPDMSSEALDALALISGTKMEAEPPVTEKSEPEAIEEASNPLLSPEALTESLSARVLESVSSSVELNETNANEEEKISSMNAPTPLPSTEEATRTMEDVVKEMLSPLIKEWLDNNMPRILEEAMREELAKTFSERKS